MKSSQKRQHYEKKMSRVNHFSFFLLINKQRTTHQTALSGHQQVRRSCSQSHAMPCHAILDNSIPDATLETRRVLDSQKDTYHQHYNQSHKHHHHHHQIFIPFTDYRTSASLPVENKQKILASAAHQPHPIPSFIFPSFALVPPRYNPLVRYLPRSQPSSPPP